MAKSKQIVDREEIAEIVAKALEAHTAKSAAEKPKFFSVKNLTSGKAIIGLCIALLAGWEAFNTFEAGRIQRRKNIDRIPEIDTAVMITSKRIDTLLQQEKWRIYRKVEQHDSLLKLEYRTEKIK